MSIIVLMVVSSQACGCASIVHGGYQEVSFKVAPADAQVTVGGSDTPRERLRTFRLARDRQHRVEARATGCETRSFYIEYRMDGWFWWNFLIPAYVISFGVDFVTGAWAQLVVPEDGFNIELVCAKTKESGDPNVAQPEASATQEEKESQTTNSGAAGQVLTSTSSSTARCDPGRCATEGRLGLAVTERDGALYVKGTSPGTFAEGRFVHGSRIALVNNRPVRSRPDFEHSLRVADDVIIVTEHDGELATILIPKLVLERAGLGPPK